LKRRATRWRDLPSSGRRSHAAPCSDRRWRPAGRWVPPALFLFLIVRVFFSSPSRVGVELGIRVRVRTRIEIESLPIFLSFSFLPIQDRNLFLPLFFLGGALELCASARATSRGSSLSHAASTDTRR
jgi:hypothetical protein